MTRVMVPCAATLYPNSASFAGNSEPFGTSTRSVLLPGTDVTAPPLRRTNSLSAAHLSPCFRFSSVPALAARGLSRHEVQSPLSLARTHCKPLDASWW